MNTLHALSRQQLEQGAQVIIGYAAVATSTSATNGTPVAAGISKPFFAQRPEDVEQLIFDDTCHANLAVYLTKKEVKALGKIVVCAALPTLRSIIRLAVEHQVNEGDVAAIVRTSDTEYTLFSTLAEMETFLNGRVQELSPEDKAQLDALQAMSREERWAFWKEAFETCIRCYACRQACPLCYCSTCAATANQPQWIPVAQHPLGNTEWHLMRAMHLAGRCITCGQCGEACPLGLPVHLLAFHLAETVQHEYGAVSGLTLNEASPMSVYKPEDTTNFIR
jgi:formate dehydrogenase (coenzyme F420) beta subunit